MKIKEYDPSNFNDLKDYWLQLENGNDMTAFQHYGWFKNINDLYFKEHIKKLFRVWKYFVVLDDNDNPLIIAPIMIVKLGFQYKFIGLKKGAYFIGRQGYTDYFNFIYNHFHSDVIDFLLKHLKNKYGVKYCCFDQVLEDTQFYKYLADNYNIKQTSITCASLKLPDSFEAYNKLLSKSTRQNIRTAINRQNRDNIILTHEFIVDFNKDIMEELLLVRKERLGKKNKSAFQKSSLAGKLNLFGTRIIKKFFSAKHDIIENSYNPWCLLIKNGDEIAGYFWGINDEYKNAYYVILAAVREKYAWYSPSISHLYLFLQEYYNSNNKNITVLDFTSGGERYKFDLGGKNEIVGV